MLTQFKFFIFFVVLILVALMGTTRVVFGQTVWYVDKYDIERVYDGDTIYINLDGLPPVFGKDIGIRIFGVDTPELRSRCPTEEGKVRERRLAREARDAVIDLVEHSQEIEIRVNDSVDDGRAAFWRVEADVFIDGTHLGAWLVRENHAINSQVGDDNKYYWCNPNDLR